MIRIVIAFNLFLKYYFEERLSFWLNFIYSDYYNDDYYYLLIQ